MSAGEKKAQCRGRQPAAMGKVNFYKKYSVTDMTAAQGFTAGFDCAFYQILCLTTGRWAGKVKFPNLTRRCGSLASSPRNMAKNRKNFSANLSIADMPSNWIEHIRQAFNVQYPRGLAASLEPGSVTGLPFFMS